MDRFYQSPPVYQSVCATVACKSNTKWHKRYNLTDSVCVCLLAADDEVDGAIEVLQPYTAIRLVSSGLSYNSVTVRHQQLAVPDYK